MVSLSRSREGGRNRAARHARADSEPGPGKPCIQGLVRPIRASRGAFQVRRTRNPRSVRRPRTLGWSVESALSDIQVHRCIACHDRRPTCPIMPQAGDAPEPLCARRPLRADGAPRPRQHASRPARPPRHHRRRSARHRRHPGPPPPPRPGPPPRRGSPAGTTSARWPRPAHRCRQSCGRGRSPRPLRPHAIGPTYPLEP